MSQEPVQLEAAFARFDEQWSPRIVTTVNDYDVRIAKVSGDHVWHAHQHTDEFFLVLDGELSIALREDGTERVVTLPAGSVFTVPRGVEHRPSAAAGAKILMLEPSGTVTTGEHADTADGTVPSHQGIALDSR
jgi:mannose-6-phosphate isomerase-like protein (cupin superfamily)